MMLPRRRSFIRGRKLLIVRNRAGKNLLPRIAVLRLRPGIFFGQLVEFLLAARATKVERITLVF